MKERRFLDRKLDNKLHLFITLEKTYFSFKKGGGALPKSTHNLKRHKEIQANSH